MNTLLNVRVLISSILVIFALSSVGWAATYYVSPSGNDSNPGTQTSPWKTVNKVNNTNLQPGDTVLFQSGGTWNEQLIPVSGTGESSRITYGAYSSGAQPLINNLQAWAKSYVTINDLNFTPSNNVAPAELLGGAVPTSHITLNNCTLIASSTSTAARALWLSYESHYNKILNCTIETNNPNVYNDAIILTCNANYNLIEGNTIRNGSHFALTGVGQQEVYGQTVNYCVVRNNTIIVASNFGGGIDFPDTHYSLIDNNVIIGGGENSYNNGFAEGIEVNNSDNIIRRNLIRDAYAPNQGAGGFEAVAYVYDSMSPFQQVRNRYYNNTVLNMVSANGISGAYVATGNAPDAVVDNVVFVNNIFSNNSSGGADWQTRIWWNGAYTTNIVFQNNVYYKSGGTLVVRDDSNLWTVATAQANKPTVYIGNVQADPKLDSNYFPQSGSPAIDAGAFLTTVTSPTGSGSTLTLADAKYFTDGYGIVTGDTIQVGNQTAIITSINYDTNTLALDRSISWTNGQGVSLPYNGSKPDIGAYEYQGTPNTPPSPPKNLRIN